MCFLFLSPHLFRDYLQNKNREEEEAWETEFTKIRSEFTEEVDEKYDT